MTTVRLGIAGLGQAAHMLLPALSRTQDIELVTVADPNEQNRRAFAIRSDVRRHSSLADLVGDPGVDLVYIATPTHLHAEHVMAVLAAGKHVIVEKPMATNLADAKAMVDAAEHAGRVLMVGHSQSYEPPIQEMARLVRSGDLGPLTMVHSSYYTDWLYRPRTPEELDTALGGGVVFRQGAHQVDIIRWIGGGLLRSVRASTTSTDPARPTEGSHVLFLEFESGAAATAVFSGYDRFHTTDLTGVAESGRPVLTRDYRAAGRSAHAPGSAEELARKQSVGTTTVENAPHASMYGMTIVSCERGDIRQVPGGLDVFGDERRLLPIPAVPSGRDVMLAEAVAAIRDGMPTAHNGRWGMATLAVCLAALESARTHREVELKHQVPVRA